MSCVSPVSVVWLGPGSALGGLQWAASASDDFTDWWPSAPSDTLGCMLTAMAVTCCVSLFCLQLQRRCPSFLQPQSLLWSTLALCDLLYRYSLLECYTSQRYDPIDHNICTPFCDPHTGHAEKYFVYKLSAFHFHSPGDLGLGCM